jgi:hypothetical protein
MQRSEYQQRRDEVPAAPEQNGKKIGDVVREATATLSSG